MHNFDIRNISLGQIKYFVEIAEHNSFTKAAEHLHISQSTISKSLASLETMLGLILFTREKKSIHLTPAGRHLYEKWKQLVEQIDVDIQDASQIQAYQKTALTVGALDSFNPDIFIFPSIEHFKKNHSSVVLRVENSSAQELSRKLIENELDVAFSVLYDIEEIKKEQLDYIVLGESPHMVCMQKSNPLAQKEKLYVTDLATSNFIGISPLQTPSYITMLINLCKPYGFTPDFTCYTSTANSLALNLVSEQDIFICDKFFRDFNSRHLCTKPLENTKSGFVIVWKKENESKNKMIRLFLDEAAGFFSRMHSKLEWVSDN